MTVSIISLAELYAIAGVVLIMNGLFGLIICAHLLRKIIAFNIMGSGTLMVLIALANRAPNEQPDPVPHAMALTGIVVAVSTTALALLLLQTIRTKSGQITFSELSDADE